MCEFPSWIETKTGEAYFLEDKDLDLPQLQGLAPKDCVGHSAILRVFPNIKGEHKEDFSCHSQVAKAIREGRMKQIMKAGGYAFVFVNENGKFHRTDGPAAERSNGDKAYFQNGFLHRIDGPAIECSNGDKFYYQDGISHRTDGPAVEYSNGYKEDWIHDKRLTLEEFNSAKNNRQ